MKFDIGVRVVGRTGALQGVQGIIQSRLKVGTQNILSIRWNNGQESRVGTGAVRVLGAGGPNEVVGQVNQANPAPQAEDVDGDGSDDDISQRSESSDDSEGGDLGDQDGYIQYFNFF
jgi:hypothetical protein